MNAHNVFKYSCPALLTISLCTALNVAFAEPKKLDGIAAVVGKNVVTISELNERVDNIKQRSTANNITLPDNQTLKNQVLDHLISEEMQLQRAERVGFRQDPQEVDNAYKNIIQNSGLSPADFERQLLAEGSTVQELKENITRELTIQNIQRALVSRRIQIAELEIDNFLKSADAQFWISPEYRLGHILVALPQSPSASDLKTAEEKAQNLYEQLSQGGDFANAAIANSDGQLALNGGDLGWRKSSDLPTLFAQLVKQLEVGNVSTPTRSGAGFHILKLYEKRGDETRMITQSKVRHILVKPSAVLSDQEAKEKLSKIRQEIIDGADFAELAKENSEDIGSMLSGGDLGWSNPGQFVPEFEKTIEQTPVKDISQPFRSQFGWHILQVLEKRDEDVTDRVLRNRAENIIMSRRFEDELQLWLRELRDDVFIDIKI